jgi:hypothetical protein
MKNENFITHAINIYNDKYDYSKVNYVNNNTKVNIVCKIHGLFAQTPKNHLHNHGCPKCGVIAMSKTQALPINQFIEKSNKANNYQYDYSKVIYKNNKTKVIVSCKKHGDFEITPSHHYNGHGCKKCSNNYRKTNFEYIEACKIIHNNLYDYSKVIYKNNKTSVKIICSIHGEFSQIAQHHINGCGCPNCNKSKGELAVKNVLNDNKIKFTPQKTFDDCLSFKGNKLRYDFYLLEKNICIEFDGEQHYKPLSYFGGAASYNDLVKNDEIKTKYCAKNNILLIRIKYDQNIEETLKQKLKLNYEKHVD